MEKLKIVANLRLIRKKLNEIKNNSDLVFFQNGKTNLGEFDSILERILDIENKIKESVFVEIKSDINSDVKKEIYADLKSIEGYLSKVKDVPISIIKNLNNIRENTIGNYVPNRNEPNFNFFNKGEKNEEI